MKANARQKQIIHMNAERRGYTKDILVVWATGDETKTSCNDLTFQQANEIIVRQLRMRPVVDESTPLFWAYFDKKNKQHQYIQSLLYQLKWVTQKERGGPRWVDLERFGKWLQSDKAPINKPLKKMSSKVKPGDKISEVSKTISALESMLKKTY